MSEPQEATRGEKRWDMLAHALTFAGWVIPLAILLAPALVGWSNRESAYVQLHARASLRFQTSCLIYELVGLGLMGACYLVFVGQGQGGRLGFWLVALTMVSPGLLGLMWAVAVMGLVLHASVRARAGVHYGYPFTLMFVR